MQRFSFVTKLHSPCLLVLQACRYTPALILRGKSYESPKNPRGIGRDSCSHVCAIGGCRGRTNDKKTRDVIQGDAQDVGDRAKTEEDQAKRRVKKHKDKARDAMEDESGDDAESDDSESDDSESDDSESDGSESDDSDHGKARHEATERGDRAGKGLDNAAGRGNEKSQEMRARRDERKAIKEEYKTGDKA